jgi:hypothetical protein
MVGSSALKAIRQTHCDIGVFPAPTVILFAITVACRRFPVL